MKPSRNVASSLVLGATTACVCATPAARSDEIGRIVQAADRCAAYGADYVDMHDGTCRLVSGHIRVQVGSPGLGGFGWTTSGTSNAALRSDGAGMLPGTGDPHHVRVRSGLQSYSPFR